MALFLSKEECHYWLSSFFLKSTDFSSSISSVMTASVMGCYIPATVQRSQRNAPEVSSVQGNTCFWFHIEAVNFGQSIVSEGRAEFSHHRKASCPLSDHSSHSSADALRVSGCENNKQSGHDAPRQQFRAYHFVDRILGEPLVGSPWQTDCELVRWGGRICKL